MNIWPKWALLIVAGLLVLVIVGAGVVYAMTEKRLKPDYIIPAESVPLPISAAEIAKGKHVAILTGCVDWHGPNLAERAFFESPMVGRLAAPNLTGAKGDSA